MRTIVSLVSLVAAGAIFFTYTQPQYDAVQKVNASVAQYDLALLKANELQQLKQTLLTRYNTFDPAQVARLQKLLPDHVDNVRLILDIDSMAGKHGMALQNVVVNSAGTAQVNQASVGAVGASKTKYDSLTIKFSTLGNYQTFKQFIADIEQSLRVADLVALSISRVSDGSVSSVEPVFTYDITLRTYWLK